MSGYEGARGGWFSPTAHHWPIEFAANVARDADTNERLRQTGWLVLRFWEHEDAAGVAQRIRQVVQTKLSSPHPYEEK